MQIHYDHNIFTSINDTSAYILGLIWADGNLYYPKNGRKPILDITSVDHDIMVPIHDIITPAKKLYTYQPKKGRLAYSVKTRSPDIIASLEAAGLVPRKSYNAIWPQIDLGDYKWSFVRGVFDGDGCVFRNTVNGYEYLHTSFTGCRNAFVNTLYSTLEQKGLEPHWYNDKRTNSFQIKIYKQQCVSQLASLMYENAGLCLNRKRSLLQSPNLQHS